MDWNVYNKICRYISVWCSLICTGRYTVKYVSIFKSGFSLVWTGTCTVKYVGIFQSGVVWFVLEDIQSNMLVYLNLVSVWYGLERVQ